MASLGKKMKHAARSAGLLTGGAAFMAVGLAFLTTAAWIYLVTIADTLTAAGVIGGAYVGLGLLMIGLGQRSDTDTRQAPRPEARVNPNQPPLMQAFIYGVEAGTSWSKR